MLGILEPGSAFWGPAVWVVRNGRLKQNSLQNTSLSFLLKSLMNYCAQKSATMKAKHIKLIPLSQFSILCSTMKQHSTFYLPPPFPPQCSFLLSQNVLTCHLCSYFLVFLPWSFVSCLQKHCQELELMKQDHFFQFPVVPQQSWRLQ